MMVLSERNVPAFQLRLFGAACYMGAVIMSCREINTEYLRDGDSRKMPDILLIKFQ